MPKILALIMFFEIFLGWCDHEKQTKKTLAATATMIFLILFHTSNSYKWHNVGAQHQQGKETSQSIKREISILSKLQINPFVFSLAKGLITKQFPTEVFRVQFHLDFVAQCNHKIKRNFE